MRTLQSSAIMSEIVPGKQEACSDQQWTPGQPSFPVRAAPQNFTLQAKIEQSRGGTGLEKYSTEATPTRKTGDETETNSEWQPRAVPRQTTSKYQTQMQISWLPPFPRPHDKVPPTEHVAPGTEQAIFISFTSRAHTGCSDEFGNL